MFKDIASIGILDEDPIRHIMPIQPDSDPVQGTYTDEQVEAMYSHLEESVKGILETRDVRARRFRVMLTLLLNSGADLREVRRVGIRQSQAPFRR